MIFGGGLVWATAMPPAAHAVDKQAAAIPAIKTREGAVTIPPIAIARRVAGWRTAETVPINHAKRGARRLADRPDYSRSRHRRESTAGDARSNDQQGLRAAAQNRRQKHSASF